MTTETTTAGAPQAAATATEPAAALNTTAATPADIAPSPAAESPLPAVTITSVDPKSGVITLAPQTQPIDIQADPAVAPGQAELRSGDQVVKIVNLDTSSPPPTAAPADIAPEQVAAASGWAPSVDVRIGAVLAVPFDAPEKVTATGQPITGAVVGMDADPAAATPAAPASPAFDVRPATYEIAPSSFELATTDIGAQAAAARIVDAVLEPGHGLVELGFRLLPTGELVVSAYGSQASCPVARAVLRAPFADQIPAFADACAGLKECP